MAKQNLLLSVDSSSSRPSSSQSDGSYYRDLTIDADIESKSDLPHFLRFLDLDIVTREMTLILGLLPGAAMELLIRQTLWTFSSTMMDNPLIFCSCSPPRQYVL